MNIKNKRKTAIAFVLSMLILMLSVVCCMPKIADATSNTGLWYIRHDYSKNEYYSFTSYKLTLEQKDNVQNSRMVIGDNNFVPDSDLSVVKIETSITSGSTGFIIDKHKIVTAAHSVYDISNEQSPFRKFKVFITDTEGNKIKTIEPKYVHVPKLYAECSNVYQDNAFDYDYAMIEVEEDLSEYGFFGLGVATDEFISQKSIVTVSGYPSYDFDGDGKEEWGKKYKSSGNVIRRESKRIAYRVDTESGDSGGPVYVERNYFGTTYKTVIAIHTRQGNNGPAITSDLLKFYYSNSESVIN